MALQDAGVELVDINFSSVQSFSDQFVPGKTCNIASQLEMFCGFERPRAISAPSQAELRAHSELFRASRSSILLVLDMLQSELMYGHSEVSLCVEPHAA